MLLPAAGAALSRLDAAIIFEALSWGCVPTAAYLSIHNMVCHGAAAHRREHTMLGSRRLLGAKICPGTLASAIAMPCLPPATPPAPPAVIDRYGTARQRGAYLTALTSMEALASYCLTEPSAGSDASALKMTARREGASGDYILNGAKAFIRSAWHTRAWLVLGSVGVGSGCVWWGLARVQGSW